MSEPENSETKPKNKHRRWVKPVLYLTILALILGAAWLARFVFWLRLENEAMDSLESGRFMKAREQGRQALSLMSFLPDTKSFAISLRFMMNLYACRRQFEQAETYGHKLLDFDKRAYGEKSVAVADDLAGLALMKRKQRKFSESENLYKSAVEIYQSNLQSETECARVKALLAWVLMQQDKSAEAEKYLADSDAVLKKHFGDLNFERLVGLVESAYLAKKQGNEDAAKTKVEEAYKIATEPKDLEKSSAQTVVVLNLMAQLLQAEGNEEKALKCFELAEANCRSSVFGGGYNTYMADILEPHAKLLQKKGQAQEAMVLKRRAAQIRNIRLS